MFFVFFSIRRYIEETKRSRNLRHSRSSFNYSALPEDYYDAVVQGKRGIRSEWHQQKFHRALDCLPKRKGQSLLDVGCFSGTFLSKLSPIQFSRQVGVDILENPIEYAKKTFGENFRKFYFIKDLGHLNTVPGKFDCITIIEVIEHLSELEIRRLFHFLHNKLERHGTVFLSTPNYHSAWPLLEYLINHFSEISYEEQHITRFTYFNIERKLSKIIPDFKKHFKIKLRTTSHTIAPFLAAFSPELATKASQLIPLKMWKWPYGALVLILLEKKD